MHDPHAWTLDFEAVVFVPALALAYILAARRYRAERWRIACFAAALVLILAVFVTPLHVLALRYLLSVHLLQNVVLAEWAPALFVLALPPGFAAAAGRLRMARVLTHPLVALPLWLSTYFAWHVPAAYDAALRHSGSLIHVEHVCYFVAGLLFWWPVLQDEPQRLSSGTRAMYLFGAFVLASPLGLLLALIPRPIYHFYEHAHRLRGISALEDQQVGGAAMSLEQAAVLFIGATYFFLRFLAGEGRADTFRSLQGSSYNQTREVGDGR
jgi:cytochrome c oxidase assembly factor CtaG